MAYKPKVAGDALAQAAARASDAGRRLAELAAAMQDKAQESVHATRRHSEEYSDQLRERVSKYPLASIGIAMLIGAIVSALLARR
jgi:ElaB/YqjD/DUF883 family membrane-anchored ribosome-binding protein